jgi:phosphoribosyl 1,2-cyclic phosphate phosphodiesterase
VSVQVTVLGSGTAGGTPRLGNDWGVCDPREPKNRRLRASICVDVDGIRILIDTSPDLRQQALANGIDRVDAVLYTHAHADHCHGIDDLRFFRRPHGTLIRAFGDRSTLSILENRFPYVFVQQPDRLYPPILAANVVDGPFSIGAVEVIPFRQGHGNVDTLGFRIGGMAYSTDVVHLAEDAFAVLAGIDTWIVDCLQATPHPTHAHLDLALAWIGRIRPRRAILTHINPTLDHARLAGSLPSGVEPAFDGMVVRL